MRNKEGRKDTWVGGNIRARRRRRRKRNENVTGGEGRKDAGERKFEMRVDGKQIVNCGENAEVREGKYDSEWYGERDVR